jgi:hypothetical protein
MPSSVEPTSDLVAIAAAVLARGGTLDDAARAVLQATKSPVFAIKTLRIAQPGLTLAEAKPIIDRNLSPTARFAHEQLLDEVERALGTPD